MCVYIYSSSIVKAKNPKICVSVCVCVQAAAPDTLRLFAMRCVDITRFVGEGRVESIK